VALQRFVRYNATLNINVYNNNNYYYYRHIVELQGAQIKNNPVEKCSYFSSGSTDLSHFQIVDMSIRATDPANFIVATAV